MLLELTVRNFAIIDQLNLEFGPGFTILTGETGAGKSIIIDGISLLLGSRADSTMVRTGAKRAQIEGVFSPAGAVAALLEEQQLQGDEPDRLVLAREVRANGRSVSRVNGRVVSLGQLRQISAGLVDIHGQTEHLSLMRVREHINLLDRYAGLEEDRAAVGKLVRQLEEVRSELKQLLRDERELARRVDLLAFQTQEIRSANLQLGEDQALQEERTRLANAEQLAALTDEAYSCFEGSAFEAGGAENLPAVQDLLAAAVRVLAKLSAVDPSQDSLRQDAEQMSFQADELTGALRDYRERIESSPGRLAAVEERLEQIRSLQRKYGDSIEEVLAYAERAAAELDSIGRSEERIPELQAEEERILRAIGEAGAELSTRRRAAAASLGAAVEHELGDLRMPAARFGVEIQWRPDPEGAYVPAQDGIEAPADRVRFSASGLDWVEFLISLNPGEPLKPMVKIASGGETSRLMLAIKTVLSRADQTPTLIFDEIDQGIGGRAGHMVGGKLWSLSRGQTGQRQTICITHLPQLASFGDAHFRVEKRVSGGRTTTSVQLLETMDDREGELAQMLGGETAANRRSARELLARVRREKPAAPW